MSKGSPAEGIGIHRSRFTALQSRGLELDPDTGTVYVDITDVTLEAARQVKYSTEQFLLRHAAKGFEITVRKATFETDPATLETVKTLGDEEVILFKPRVTTENGRPEFLNLAIKTPKGERKEETSANWWAQA